MISHLRLAWRLARRELRGGARGFRVFLACLTLGVAAIAAVASISQAVTSALESDARVLLGGDIDIRLTQRTLTADEDAYIRAHVAARSNSADLRAMARPEREDGPPAMVELKSVDAAYPLSGRITLQPDSALPLLLAKRDGIWGAVADPTLLARLGVSIGDRLRVGEATLELRASIVREPDRVASVASFGPRLMIAEGALPATGLVQPGSLVRYQTRVLLPPATDAAQWMAAARDAFPQAGWQLRDARDAAPGVARFVDRLSMFLGFAGLTALLIGGLGVAGAVGSYLDGKTRVIATLKCLGAAGSLVTTTYLLQILILAGLGTLAGVAIGALLPLGAIQLVGPLLPVPIAAGIYPSALLTAAALGLLTALTFSLWPLGRAREVPAANLFRQSVAAIAGRPRAGTMVVTLVSAMALAVLVILTADDWIFGAIFVAGAVAVLATLRAGAAIVTAVVQRLPRVGHAIVRVALDSLKRPGAPTATVVTSLGAGLTVLVAVSLIDSNLHTQIGERLPRTVPAFFFIDIQNDQAATFDATVRAIDGVGELRRVPVLRGRIVRIAGMPVEQATVAPESRWAIDGDRALTFSAVPPEDADFVAGTWWPADYVGPPLISLDAGLAKGFGVGIGDTLTLNILGRDIEAKIASLRKIEWRAVPFDFAIIFTPGALAGAPFTHVAAVQAPPAKEAALERAVADRFANITAIRTREAIETVNRLMQRIGLGVRAAAAVTILAGALVLAGAIAADRHRRAYEAVLFKVLGATRRRIALIYLVEYGLLGAATAAVAAALGTAIAWAVTVRMMRLEWEMDGRVIAFTTAIGVALTLLIGFAGTWRRLGRSAAAMLRNE